VQEFVDIAGLVAGASKGEGLGNKFLAHIRNVSMILQVVRCFEGADGTEQVTHVEGSVDPARDMEIINTELLLADLESLTTARAKLEKRTKLDAEAQKRLDLMHRTIAVLDEGQPARSVLISAEEWPTFHAFQLLTRCGPRSSSSLPTARGADHTHDTHDTHDTRHARHTQHTHARHTHTTTSPHVWAASRWCTAAMSRYARRRRSRETMHCLTSSPSSSWASPGRGGGHGQRHGGAGQASRPVRYPLHHPLNSAFTPSTHPPACVPSCRDVSRVSRVVCVVWW
jgi:hypothetical protein